MIKKYPLISTKTENIIDTVKDYLSTNKCCPFYPECTHPRTQSDPYIIFDKRLKNVFNEVFDSLKQASQETIDNKLKTGNVEIEILCWAFFQEKETIISKETWHNHLDKNKPNQTSFLIYLTPTDLGTIFINEYGAKQILIPETNCIYVWDSKYLHSPAPGDVKNDRIVLAGCCFF
tara:strand:+ start:117 stop:644 length:528 start_codon:yes stop_codon:yes gene_type:complete